MSFRRTTPPTSAGPFIARPAPSRRRSGASRSSSPPRPVWLARGRDVRADGPARPGQPRHRRLRDHHAEQAVPDRAGVFVAIAVVSVIASFLSQRRTGNRSARAERRLHRNHLAEPEREPELITVRQREVDERLHPDPARLAGLVSHRRHLDSAGRATAISWPSAWHALACRSRVRVEARALPGSHDPVPAQAPRAGAGPPGALPDGSLTSPCQLSGAGQRDHHDRLLRAHHGPGPLARSPRRRPSAHPADLRVMAAFAPMLAGTRRGLNGCRTSARDGATSTIAPRSPPPCRSPPGTAALTPLLEEHVQPRLRAAAAQSRLAL